MTTGNKTESDEIRVTNLSEKKINVWKAMGIVSTCIYWNSYCESYTWCSTFRLPLVYSQPEANNLSQLWRHPDTQLAYRGLIFRGPIVRYQRQFFFFFFSGSLPAVAQDDWLIDHPMPSISFWQGNPGRKNTQGSMTYPLLSLHQSHFESGEDLHELHNLSCYLPLPSQQNVLHHIYYTSSFTQLFFSWAPL